MSLHRSCCPCAEDNPNCEDCPKSTYTITNIVGSVTIYADCTLSGMWTGSDITYTIPSSLTVATNPNYVCGWTGCSRWTTFSETVTFCPPGDYPETCPAEPSCTYDIRFRLCGLMESCGIVGCTVNINLWVEMQQRTNGGAWTDCKDYTDPTPQVGEFFPWSMYVQDALGGGIEPCVRELEDIDIDSSGDAFMPDEFACAAGLDCLADCGEGTYTINPPSWLYSGDASWGSTVQVT